MLLALGLVGDDIVNVEVYGASSALYSSSRNSLATYAFGGGIDKLNTALLDVCLELLVNRCASR